MNQSKFSFADLFTVLATVGFGFFCFLSLNFLSLGETVPSIIGATVLALILGGLALGVKLLKKTSRNFKTCIIWEWLLLFFFVVMAVFVVIPFSHYFLVSEQKTEIQQKVSDCISQSEGMFDDYQTYAENRIDTYEQELENAISKGHDGRYMYPSTYEKFQFQVGSDDNQQLNDKIKDLRNGLFEYPFSFQAEKEKDTAWLTEAKETMASWSPISVVDVVSNVRSNLEQWHNNLNEISKFRPKGKNGNVIENAKDFDKVYPQTLCADDMEEYFTGEYMQDLANTTALCWAAGLYALMLLSYFITKRHPRYPGLKVIFGTGGVKDNEL
jgi:cell division protein ZapA (FtsZ GTPase activity inhibitor)